MRLLLQDTRATEKENEMFCGEIVKRIGILPTFPDLCDSDVSHPPPCLVWQQEGKLHMKTQWPFLFEVKSHNESGGIMRSLKTPEGPVWCMKTEADIRSGQIAKNL